MRRALVFPRATDVTWRARIVRFCVHAKASELGRSRSCEAAHPARASLPSPLPFPTAPGSHFFQNILSFGIGYATVNSDEIADASDAGMEVRHTHTLTHTHTHRHTQPSPLGSNLLQIERSNGQSQQSISCRFHTFAAPFSSF
eukprot:6186254-Pleurochrysis_carterae.AAC.2